MTTKIIKNYEKWNKMEYIERENSMKYVEGISLEFKNLMLEAYK